MDHCLYLNPSTITTQAISKPFLALLGMKLSYNTYGEMT